MKYLSDAQYQQFQDDGYLVIEKFLTPEELQAVHDDIQRVIDENSNLTADAGAFNLEKASGFAFDQDSPAVKAGAFRKITPAVTMIPAAGEVFTSTKMLDCMEDLMGENIYYHSSKVMLKPAGHGSAKPWHQDAAYWRAYDPKQITVWIAIHDATEENGCVWAIPGSHKLGIIPHVKRELQVEESMIDLTKAVPVPVPAGGMLIFHSLVLHMSHPNKSDKSRWAIICDYDCMPNPPIDTKNEILPGAREDGVWPLRGVDVGTAEVAV